MRGKPGWIALAILLVLPGSLFLAAQSQSGPAYQVVVSADPVELDVAVTQGNGRAVLDLQPEDFTVLEDGQPQQIRDLEAVGMPYSILVLVDRSARRENSNWPKFILQSVDVFLRNLRGPDRLAVAAFDTRVAVLVDWRPTRNGRVQKVLLRPSEQPTKFFDAVDWASEEMTFITTPGTSGQVMRFGGRKGVIVFTDGRDTEMYPDIVRVNGQNIPDPLYEVPTSVEERFRQSRQILQTSKIPFYFVAVDTDRQLPEKSAVMRLDGWMRFLAEVRTRIEQLASASGGRAIFPRRIEDIVPLYEQIQRDLGSGYHIRYTPQRPADTRLRRIEVRVRGYDVHQARDSYYAR